MYYFDKVSILEKKTFKQGQISRSIISEMGKMLVDKKV